MVEFTAFSISLEQRKIYAEYLTFLFAAAEYKT
jgi:hypothetical protein